MASDEAKSNSATKISKEASRELGNALNIRVQDISVCSLNHDKGLKSTIQGLLN